MQRRDSLMEKALATSMARIDEGPDAALRESLGGTDPVSPAQTESRRESVEALAYQFWEERGRPMGSPEEDWFRAEVEIGSRQVGAV
jgi:hypothetical protein